MRDENDDRDPPPPPFPDLHINNDAAGVPRPPPTNNKMAPFDVDSSSSSPPLPPRNDGASSSSSHIVSEKRKPTRPHSAKWFYPKPKRREELGKALKNNQTVGHDKCVKKEEFSGQNLTTDEVVKFMGPKQFVEARKIMIHQHKLFSWQIFELHRLITVQRTIAKSPDTLHNYNKFPPINKLLYVSPLDTSSSSPKTKTYDRVDKGHLAPNPPPNNWCFPPPPPGGNQWLIPVKSPSEGLVYKPYPGLMPPVFGNCHPISLAPNDYNSESYFQPYPMPLMNASCSTTGEVDGNSHTKKESERLGRDELSLFPTTPSIEALLKEQRNEHKVQVIKVVPHNPDSTPASAARILQSIQEGRRNQDSSQ